MDLPLKLLLFIATPLLLFAGVVFFVASTLSADDLSHCSDTPSLTSQQCKEADMIVAISGGDTGARTREAIRLYQKGWAPLLFFSGAAEDKTGISNAAAMRNQALDAGVPDSAILLDEEARDTAANAAGTGTFVRRQQVQKLILVTSPYHQRRASIEFARALGPTVTVINRPTPEDRFWPVHWWLNPYSWYLAIGELSKLVYLNVSGK